MSGATIKLLPEDVWSRIAAGEVVERPASAVKEMVENSLDAGARRIRVSLWDGGRVRIVVEDDGRGMEFDDLPLAIAPHATSKISGVDDLEAIRTLGYRGEAIASLTAVAKVEIRSRPSGGTGGVISAFEGRVLGHARQNCPVGTRVQVDSLFENLPARRKFMKSALGELRRAAAMLRDYAICRPEVAFSLEHDGRPVFSTDGCGDRRSVIERLWGAEPPVSTVEAEAEHTKLECWIQPRMGRAAGRSETSAFVNGRSVSDPVIKAAVGSAVKGAGDALSGAWALFFEIDPSLIDVNIHPAKAEIRFRHQGEVFETVRLAADSVVGPRRVFLPLPLPQTPPQAPDSPSASQNLTLTAPHPRVMRFAPQNSAQLFSRVSWNDKEPPLKPATPTPAPPPSAAPTAAAIGRLRSGYLVFDTPEGVAIVDPHAAHERVVFERIRASSGEGMRTQPLLVPAPLPPSLLLEAEEKMAQLEEAGFAFDAKDGVTRLTAIPRAGGVFCRSGSSVPFVSPEALLRGTISALGAEGGHEVMWGVWARMACRDAVKVTTALDLSEADALWRELHSCEQPFSCPHGRPTILSLSNEELEKHFGRR
ncbi:MAG: DNA mismatch repair endonuclease MutL [Synergistaceae bacterium]|jgi:DNA mismatch repair protein MutL|nr:DNA mismatch repair endonuclease MutL [Synergistaceae bacterium]